MKKIYFVPVFILYLLIFSYASSDIFKGYVPVTPDISIDDLPGEYVNKEFYDTYKKTGSPMQAAYSCDGDYLRITKQSSDTIIYSLISDFHTVDIEIPLKRYMNNNYWRNDEYDHSIILDINKKGELLSYFNSSSKSNKYVRLSIPFSEYINRALEGKYIDPVTKKKFTFDRTGSVYADNTFIGSYEVTLDEVEGNKDINPFKYKAATTASPIKTGYYSFKYDKNALYLYNIIAEEYIFLKKPTKKDLRYRFLIVK